MDYKNFETLTWMVAQFRKSGERGITYDELHKKIVDERHTPNALTKRTFHNYLKELRNRFGIKIDCDKHLQHEARTKNISDDNKRYRYRIVEERQDDDTPWTTLFLMAFETAAAIKELQKKEEDKKYICFDCQPTGTEKLNFILDAIRNHLCVDFKYFVPDSTNPYPEHHFEVHGLVMKDYVWYVMGYTREKGKRIMPLHSLLDLEISMTIDYDEHKGKYIKKNVEYQPYTNFSAERFWEENKHIVNKGKSLTKNTYLCNL